MHQIHNVLSDVGSVWIKQPKHRCRLTVLVATSLDSWLVDFAPNPRCVKFHYHTDTGWCHHRQASTQECELQVTFELREHWHLQIQYMQSFQGTSQTSRIGDIGPRRSCCLLGRSQTLAVQSAHQHPFECWICLGASPTCKNSIGKT